MNVEKTAVSYEEPNFVVDEIEVCGSICEDSGGAGGDSGEGDPID